MITALLLAGVLSRPPVDTTHLILVATTDVRGQATDWDYTRGTSFPGGLVRVAAVVDSLRGAHPGRVVVVDGGDAATGTPFGSYFVYVAPRTPNPIVDAMNALQYDAGTLGEHDLDAGMPALNQRLAAATYHVVDANLVVLGGREDTLAFRPYTLIERSGVKVAIAGFTTPGAMVWNRDQLRGRFRLDRVPAAAQRVLPEMKRDADVTIVLAHMGLDEFSTYDTTGIGAENAGLSFATGAARPDIVVLGHTGRTIADSVVGGVHFVQPGQNAERVAVVHIDLVQKDGRWVPVRIRGESVPLEGARPPAGINRRLQDEHRVVLTWVNELLGGAMGPMRATLGRVEDTPLIEWLTDVMRRRAGADLASTPVFDTRSGFDVGDVTRRQVLGIYPPDYTLRAVRITGTQLRAYLERSARYFYVDSTGRVAPNLYVPATSQEIVGGAEYLIDLEGAPGSRIRDLQVRGRPVTASDTFTLAMSNYRQTGAGGYDMLADAPVVYDKGERIVDLLAEEVRSRKTLRPEDFDRRRWALQPEALRHRAQAMFLKPAATARRDSVPTPLFGPDPAKIRQDSIRRVRAKADSAANVPIAAFSLPLLRGAAGGPFGVMVAEAYRNTLRTDFGMVGVPDLKQDLPAGVLTVGALAAAWTDSSTLNRVTLSGRQLRALLEQSVGGDSAMCGFAGGTVTWDPGARVGRRVKSVVLTNGKKLDDGASYSLAVSGTQLRRLTLPPGTKDAPAPVVEATDVSAQTAFGGYLHRLPQPVVPPTRIQVRAEQ
jgi:2',3'-cyclic-nucleotide 2'-phosphodiesterase (5'-nucleotidase family)